MKPAQAETRARVDQPKRVALIVSTYNTPWYLERTLSSILGQIVHPDELIVVDDGSTPETAELINRYRPQLPCLVRHLWQAHNGFRKNRLLNHALAVSTSDYLVFVDGDCVHHPGFVQAHIRRARPRTFLAGGDVRLPQGITRCVTLDDVRRGRVFSVPWLMRSGMRWQRTAVKPLTPRVLAPLVDAVNISPARFGGSNASCWRADAVRIGGFDERYGWGKGDVDFGERLRNDGVRSAHVRYSAICMHLDHPRLAVPHDEWRRNLAWVAQVVRTGVTRPVIGIDCPRDCIELPDPCHEPPLRAVMAAGH